MGQSTNRHQIVTINNNNQLQTLRQHIRQDMSTQLAQGNINNRSFSHVKGDNKIDINEENNGIGIYKRFTVLQKQKDSQQYKNKQGDFQKMDDGRRQGYFIQKYNQNNSLNERNQNNQTQQYNLKHVKSNKQYSQQQQQKFTNISQIQQNLTSIINPLSKQQHTSKFQHIIFGIGIGIIITILIFLIIIIHINNLSIANQSHFSRDFPTWRGISLWIFYLWMLGFDIFIFNKYNVKYRQILKFKSNHYPQAISVFRVALVFSCVFVIMFLMYVLDLTGIYQLNYIDKEYYALLCWSLYGIFVILPFPIISNKGRYYLFNTIIKILIFPINGVTFPITWLTNQGTSMVVALSDLRYTVCYYTEIGLRKDRQNICDNINNVSTVFVIAVGLSVVRVLQNIRQGYDKGKYLGSPFFYNTLKYIAIITTAILAYLYKQGQKDIKLAWIIFGSFSSMFSFCWDLRMNWDLLHNNNKHPYLRQRLTYGSPRLYYLIMIGDFFMRLTWVMTISPKIAQLLGNVNLVSLVTGMIQIFRRCVWNLLRVERQHIALVIIEEQQQSKLQQTIRNNNLKQQQELISSQSQCERDQLSLQVRMIEFLNKFKIKRQQFSKQIIKKIINKQQLNNKEQLSKSYKQLQQQQFQQLSIIMQQLLTTNQLQYQQAKQ